LITGSSASSVLDGDRITRGAGGRVRRAGRIQKTAAFEKNLTDGAWIAGRCDDDAAGLIVGIRHIVAVQLDDALDIDVLAGQRDLRIGDRLGVGDGRIVRRFGEYLD
jgi:hypothetical protein